VPHPLHVSVLGPSQIVATLAQDLRHVAQDRRLQIQIQTPENPDPEADLSLLVPCGLWSTPKDQALRARLMALGQPFRIVAGEGQNRLDNALLALGMPPLDTDMGTLREQAQYALNRGRTLWSCEKCSDPDCEHRLFTALLRT